MVLKDLQNEMCPRISANDFVHLLNEDTAKIAVIDLRSNVDFKRAHINCSINIPFSSAMLAETRIDALNIPDLEKLLSNKVVCVLSTQHDNAILVCDFFVWNITTINSFY